MLHDWLHTLRSPTAQLAMSRLGLVRRRICRARCDAFYARFNMLLLQLNTAADAKADWRPQLEQPLDGKALAAGLRLISDELYAHRVRTVRTSCLLQPAARWLPGRSWPHLRRRLQCRLQALLAARACPGFAGHAALALSLLLASMLTRTKHLCVQAVAQTMPKATRAMLQQQQAQCPQQHTPPQGLVKNPLYSVCCCVFQDPLGPDGRCAHQAASTLQHEHPA